MSKLCAMRMITLFLLPAVAVGCATSAKGPSDAEQVGALLGVWKAGILAKDVNKIMSTYSEAFSHDGYEYDAESKAALREYIEGSIDEGNFDDVEVEIESADITIDGSNANIYPIDFSTYQGTVSIELIATQEKGGWRFTDMMIEGL